MKLTPVFAPPSGADDHPESQTLLKRVREELYQELRGKETIVDLSVAAFLGGGHLLLEGPPGTGKTSLAKALARAFGGSFRRVQMTSDLLPSDVVGILRFKPTVTGNTAEFEFRPGPLFTNFLLADELNRTSPKTQSALLEAMAESTATVDGISRKLPEPFFVVATQNPLESHGVYPLAESQLDRFMLHLTVTSPERDFELQIYKNVVELAEKPVAPTGSFSMTIEQTRQALAEVQKVHVDGTLLEYVTEIVRASRAAPGISAGVSVRGGLQLISASKALAFLRGRAFVTPREVADLAVPALAHRICFSGGDPGSEARASAIRAIVERIRPPR